MKKLLILALLAVPSAMCATTATAQWWIWRAADGGNDSNGGGFDPGIPGAGTNYANQAAPQVALTGLAYVSGNTSKTLTATGTPFTSAMVGNAIQITGGTNLNKNIYWVVQYNSPSSVNIDRDPTTGSNGSAGTGNLGGALATLCNLSTTGSGFLPNLLSDASALAAGNTINIRGSGSADAPTGGSGCPNCDYDFSAGWWGFAAGNIAGGAIKVVGFNGRPQIAHSNLISHQADNWVWQHIKFVNKTNLYPAFGISLAIETLIDCIVDANGYDAIGFGGRSVRLSEFRNTGATTPGGTYYAVQTDQYGTLVVGNYIHNWRGGGVYPGGGAAFSGAVRNNLIVNNGGHGIRVNPNAAIAGETFLVDGNTVDSNTGDALHVDSTTGVAFTTVTNNIFSNSGAYGLNVQAGTATLNAASILDVWDCNNFFQNATGDRNNFPVGPNDLALDPQYVSAASANYAIGKNLKGAGCPGSFLGSATISYLDIGGAQRQEAGSGGGGAVTTVHSIQ